MKNYKKEDVKFINIENTEFLVLWDQSSKGDHSMFKYEHLRLKENFSDKV